MENNILPRLVTVDSQLQIFQYKFINKVFYLKNAFQLKENLFTYSKSSLF